MRILTFVSLFFLLFYPVYGQNTVIVDERINQPVLYGPCTMEGIQDSSWYQGYHNDYHVDADLLSGLNTDLLMAADIQIVLGTWCSDSKREVPRFFRILEYLGYPLTHIEMICVDRSKEAKKTPVAELGIERVPTFIFYINGEEYARIIERPRTGSLEGDLLKIFDSH